MSKKKINASTVYLLLGLLFIALLGIRTISTPRVWTHLAQGRSSETLSYVENADVVNTTHLYDKVVHVLWNMGGASALILFNTLCLVAAFVGLLLVSKKWGNTLSQGFALLVSGSLMLLVFDVSPHSVMMLFVAIYFYVLTTVKRPAILFGALIPLQIIWTNLHLSFLLGPIMALFAMIQVIQDLKGKRKGASASALSPVLMAGLTVALLIVTVANPALFKVYGQFAANVNLPSVGYWNTLLSDYFTPKNQQSLIFLLLILEAGGLVTLKKRLPALPTGMAVIGAFMIWTMPHTILFFVALSFPFIVLSFTAVSSQLAKTIKPLLGTQSKWLSPAMQVVFVLLAIISIASVVTNCAYAKYGNTSTFGFGIEEEQYAAGAKELLSDPAFPERVINLAADGGYLAWNYPEREIMIDYRKGCYEKEVFTSLRSMLMGDKAAYDSIIDKYRPEAFVINMLDSMAMMGVSTLLSNPSWKLAYFDGTTAVLVANKPKYESLYSNASIQGAGVKRLQLAYEAFESNVDKGCSAGNPAPIIGAGKFYLALNRPAEAKAMFELLLAANPSMPRALIDLGNSQLLLKDFDAALASFEQAIEMSPRNLFAWGCYATACRYADKEEELEVAQEKIKDLMASGKKEMKEEVKAIEKKLEKSEAKSSSLEELTVPE